MVNNGEQFPKPTLTLWQNARGIPVKSLLDGRAPIDTGGTNKAGIQIKNGSLNLFYGATLNGPV